MKKIICLVIAIIVISYCASAQDNSTKDDRALTLSPNGLRVVSKKNNDKNVDWSFLNMDLGINTIIDKTDYTLPETQAFLNMESTLKNDNIFNLRQGRSWNINLWLISSHFKLVNNDNFKFKISTGLGMQVFNFKYQKPILFINNPQTQVAYLPNEIKEKSKLSVLYGSIPLMIQASNKIGDDFWLSYGIGVIGGMNLSTWTKYKNFDDKKVKNHDMFNTNTFHYSLVAEVGINDWFKLFATYQMSNLFENGLVQQPLSIGIRF